MILLNAPCESLLNRVDWRVKAIFMDPPDNLGLDYVGSTDKRIDYYPWLESIIHRALSRCDTLWISYYFRHDLEISRMIPQGIPWRKIIWRYTFGQYRETDLPNGFRYILRLGDPGNVGAVRVESERMRLGDKRARGPRVLDDVWDVPRIVGNDPSRCHWHPTQHPRRIYSWIHSYTNPLLDLFAGTGTGFHVGMEFGVELSYFYCQKIKETLPNLEITQSVDEMVRRLGIPPRIEPPLPGETQ